MLDPVNDPVDAALCILIADQNRKYYKGIVYLTELEKYSSQALEYIRNMSNPKIS